MRWPAPPSFAGPAVRLAYKEGLQGVGSQRADPREFSIHMQCGTFVHLLVDPARPQQSTDAASSAFATGDGNSELLDAALMAFNLMRTAF